MPILTEKSITDFFQRARGARCGWRAAGAADGWAGFAVCGRGFPAASERGLLFTGCPAEFTAFFLA